MQCAWAGGAARHPVRVAACGWWRRMWERRGNRGSAWTAPAAARADRLRLRGRKSCALPIGVQRNMHMTQAGGRLGEGRQRRGGGLAAKSSHHGQHHTAAARHGFGQDEVVFGVVQIGFGEQKVQTDRARLARMDLRNHMGMQGTSPGPAADGGHAALIGDDQHHLRCGGGVAACAAPYPATRDWRVAVAGGRTATMSGPAGTARHSHSSVRERFMPAVPLKRRADCACVSTFLI